MRDFDTLMSPDDTSEAPNGLAVGGVFPVNLLPILLMSAGFGIISYKLAVEKGRNTALWTTLGCIPFVNFVCIPYFIGAANYRIERKIDQLLSVAASREQLASSQQ